MPELGQPHEFINSDGSVKQYPSDVVVENREAFAAAMSAVGRMTDVVPFVPMSNKLPHPNLHAGPSYMQKVVRGRMTRWENADRNAETGAVHLGGDRQVFNFLMNPQDVSLGYSIDPGLSPDPEDPTINPIFGTANLNFSILLDRSYDVLEPHGSKYAVPNGILDDIRVLEAILAPSVKGTNPSAVAAANTVEVAFGGTYDPKNPTAPSVRAMRFFGQLTGVNVTMSHHTRNMVPTRGVVNISIRKQTSRVSQDPPGAATYGVGILTPEQLEALKVDSGGNLQQPPRDARSGGKTGGVIE